MVSVMDSDPTSTWITPPSVRRSTERISITYIPEGGQETCQECHMEKSGLGHNMQSYRSPEMAKMALDVEVEAQAYQWRDVTTMTPAANVIVAITNKAGHPIPDG